MCVCLHMCKKEIPPHLILKDFNQVFYNSLFILLKVYCILLEKLFSMLKDSENNLKV